MSEVPLYSNTTSHTIQQVEPFKRGNTQEPGITSRRYGGTLLIRKRPYPRTTVGP